MQEPEIQLTGINMLPYEGNHWATMIGNGCDDLLLRTSMQESSCFFEMGDFFAITRSWPPYFLISGRRYEFPPGLRGNRRLRCRERKCRTRENSPKARGMMIYGEAPESTHIHQDGELRLSSDSRSLANIVGAMTTGDELRGITASNHGRRRIELSAKI